MFIYFEPKSMNFQNTGCKITTIFETQIIEEKQKEI